MNLQMLQIAEKQAVAAAAEILVAALKFLQTVIPLQCAVLELQLVDLDCWILLPVQLSIPWEAMETLAVELA